MASPADPIHIATYGKDPRSPRLAKQKVVHCCLTVASALAELPALIAGNLTTLLTSGLDTNATVADPSRRKIPRAVFFGGGFSDEGYEAIVNAVRERAAGAEGKGKEKEPDQEERREGGRWLLLWRPRRVGKAATSLLLGDSKEWKRGWRGLIRWRRGGYVALDGEGGGKHEGWWNAICVGVGSIANLYVPVSDLNVLGELDVKTSLPPTAASRQGFGMLDDAVPLDDL
ncbi:hypothetical protein MMYC01_201753 [Madurella mycetomatis]|uniref:Uncharacterized protein n=1 Tax=Madurella mycetomatis TaxID=100816 RepID=A0A175WEA8_9PEZI|nr:hypothetical protein MMYC01_201753 [Madurella mycetomatis]